MSVEVLTEQLKSQLLELQYRLYSEQQLVLQYREKVLETESVPEWADWRLDRLESALVQVSSMSRRICMRILAALDSSITFQILQHISNHMHSH